MSPIETKTLIILRHAKSSWGYTDINDLDRPLKRKGIMRAYKVAEGLKRRYIFPQKIITSPANRATHTALIVCKGLQLQFDKIQIEKEFYHAEKQDVKKVVKDSLDELNAIMIVGHNPIWTELVNDWQNRKIVHLPTSGVAIIEFQVNAWKDIDAKYAKLNYLGRF
jgi:phosphohistidine phosphatase